MNMTTYQARAGQTAVYPNIGNNLTYTALGLAGEAGEFCNKLKKVMRDHHGILTEEIKRQLAEELGGVLWYVAQSCTELNVTLEGVANRNLAILERRMINDTIHGEGDER